MTAKLYFENFWESEQKNILFVFMPFDASFDTKFNKINEAAVQAGFDRAERVDKKPDSEIILGKIYDGIANSKMLLFDLSDDPKTSQVSGNVLFELGIAHAWREPEDILLIRNGSLDKVPSLIKYLPINQEDDLTVNWLNAKLKPALENQEWSRSKRVKAASKSIDGEGILLMYKFGRRPKGYKHFHSREMSSEMKMSALRLLDLGIIRCASACYKRSFEYAYRWTPFGCTVMEYMSIKELSMDEFKRSPEYQEYLKFKKGYRKFKKEIKNNPK